VFAFGCKLDDFLALCCLSDRDTFLEGGSFCLELEDTTTGGTDLLAELPIGDLESAHRLSSILAVIDRGYPERLLQLCESDAGKFHLPIHFLPRGVGHGPCGVVRLHLIVHESVDCVFLAEVLEEVLLTPALEHPVRHDDVPKIPTAGEDWRLVAGVSKPGHLPQAEFPLKKANRSIVQTVLNRTAVKCCLADNEPLLRHAANPTLTIGDEVEAVSDQLHE